jgi:hypothetical protein
VRFRSSSSYVLSTFVSDCPERRKASVHYGLFSAVDDHIYAARCQRGFTYAVHTTYARSADIFHDENSPLFLMHRKAFVVHLQPGGPKALLVKEVIRPDRLHPFCQIAIAVSGRIYGQHASEHLTLVRVVDRPNCIFLFVELDEPEPGYFGICIFLSVIRRRYIIWTNEDNRLTIAMKNVIRIICL